MSGLLVCIAFEPLWPSDFLKKIFKNHFSSDILKRKELAVVRNCGYAPGTKSKKKMPSESRYLSQNPVRPKGEL